MDRFTSDNYIGKSGICASHKRLEGCSDTHSHEFFELEYISGGTGSYTLDGEVYEIREGMFFLMTPVNFHSVKTSDADLFNVMFSEKICSGELLARCTDKKSGLAFEVLPEDKAFFVSLLCELCREGNEADYTASLLNSLLHKSLQYKDQASPAPSSVARAVVYMLRHFREDPSLASVAAVAGYTPNYFSARFKEEMGESFKQYLDRLRFDYAKKLLEHSSLTISQVCRESGFDDYPNFVRRFSARFGCSPSKLRS